MYVSAITNSVNDYYGKTGHAATYSAVCTPQATSAAASSHASKQPLHHPGPHPPPLPTPQQPRSSVPYPASAHPLSMHQRTPAPSFINRHRPPLQRPNPALLSSDVPPHMKYAPLPQARPHQNGLTPKADILPQHKPTQAGHGVNGLAPQCATVQGGSSQLGGSQAPLGVSREAFPLAFGSSNSSSRRYGSGSSGSNWGAADERKSKDPLAQPQPSADHGGVVQGRPASALQQAARPGSGCSGKADSARKGTKKQRVFDKMLSTVTGFFQTKVTEQHGGSQELQKLADLYPSDVSDGS
ncbi:hypothetical protein ABBQ38_010666 [Trebouxia sp. C0009 RCD-2024]